ncbi:hypothetical protein ACFU5O_37325 [Streptomyces sp. NPDC057445]
MCETCAREDDASIEEAWTGARLSQVPQERQDHPLVPKPKTGGGFSRLRS